MVSGLHATLSTGVSLTKSANTCLYPPITHTLVRAFTPPLTLARAVPESELLVDLEGEIEVELVMGGGGFAVNVARDSLFADSAE